MAKGNEQHLRMFQARDKLNDILKDFTPVEQMLLWESIGNELTMLYGTGAGEPLGLFAPKSTVTESSAEDKLKE